MLGMTAKGTLDTADMVASMATSAISLELMAADSNSKKKALSDVKRAVRLMTDLARKAGGRIKLLINAR